MSFSKVVLNNNNLVLYIENDRGLLFNPTNCSLYSLCAMSVAVVLLLDEGLCQQDILDTIEQKSGLAKNEIIPRLQDIMDMFNQQTEALTYSDGQYPELKALNSRHKTQPVTTPSNTYQIANASFSLQGPRGILADLMILLAPTKQPCNKVDFILLILQEQDVYNIYSNGLLVEQCEQYQEVIPLIIDRLQILAFQKCNYLFCFHGAALSCSTFNLLLPGESGAGKSTLSALLTDEEHQLFSDEYIVFQDNFDLSVIPLPIAIKSGSWQVVTDKYPQLAEAKIWQRLDGRQLKYLWPASFTKLPTHAPVKNLLIHPQYSAQAIKTEITELDVIETLTLLTASGYQLGFELNLEKLDQLIGFIQRTKRLRITYSSSDQIAKVLRAFK